MAMPELLGVGPSCFAPPPGPRYKERTLGVVWVCVGLLCAYVFVTEADKAVGNVAHKGTLTVEHCSVSAGLGRGSHEQTECTGAFRPDGGHGVVRDEAVLDGAYVPGERVRVHREGGDYEVIGWRAFWGWLALFFAGALGVCRGLTILMTGIHATTVEEITAVRSLMHMKPASAYVTALRWSALAGLVLCALLMLVWP
ncbi:hypothetical protein LE181_06115 [Streptomyces sp. SCA3-4]|uniref:hypothetical protein n=1 Tax=Streptomyces sichuanensis TaxID=2871810 RepID=UPI001CE2F150|nr:hypothetical protein [Streptomyces sichuanensis]MCA6091741.1 hypothetical protein [Streptomyces sichuanensis]